MHKIDHINLIHRNMFFYADLRIILIPEAIEIVDFKALFNVRLC